MSNTKKFSQKALVLHTAAALFAMSAHAVPYQQGSSAIATVDAGERVEKNHRHHRREKARRLHQQKTRCRLIRNRFQPRGQSRADYLVWQPER